MYKLYGNDSTFFVIGNVALGLIREEVSTLTFVLVPCYPVYGFVCVCIDFFYNLVERLWLNI